MRALLRSDVLRTALAMAALSGWMLSLFSGWFFRGAVHLLLAAALVLLPWRWLRIRVEETDPRNSAGDSARPGPPEGRGDTR